MKYLYKGKNPKTEQKIEKYFQDEYDAEVFADDNSIDYPIFKVIDLENNETIYSDSMAQDQVDLANDNMFPDEESREGFDVDDFFDKD